MGRRRKPKAKHQQHVTSTKEAKHQQHVTSTKELPTDVVLFHILPRLPAKSLCRFRFVSKQWYSFITTPEFAQMHLHHQIQNQNHHKLLLLSDETFRTIDCANPDKDIVWDINVPYPFNGVIYDPESVVASLHGMVCLRVIKNCKNWRRHSLLKYSNYNIILWNPVTDQYKRLSEAGFPKDGHQNNGYDPLIGLYYTSSDNDYKLLFVTCWKDPNVYIYSLKSDSWRKVDYLIEVDFKFRLAFFHTDNWRRATTSLLNEKLFFLVQRGYFESRSYSILRFDTKTEKLTKIAIPAFPGNIYVECLSILVARGCTHLCCKIHNNSHVELWRMDGDGDWTKVASSFPWDQEPLHLLRSDNWFMLSKLVDMKKHTTKWLSSFRRSTTTIVEYTETIVSPNQYTK